MQKKSWKDNIKIKHRLGLIGLIAVAGLMISTTIHVQSIQFLEMRSHENVQLSETMERFDTLHTQLKREHTMLLSFLKTGDEQKLSDWQKTKQGNTAELSALNEALPDNADIHQQAQQIQSNVQAYMTQANQAVKLRQDLGLNEKDGVQGELRKAVHQAEAVLKQHQLSSLTISMLMLRRHEKDFMLRGKDKYLEKSAKEFQHFESLLTSSNLSKDMKMKISSLMQQYQQKFQRYAQESKKLNVASASLEQFYNNRVEGSLSSLDERFAAYITDKKTETFALQAKSDTQFFIMMALMIAFIIAVITWISRTMLQNIQSLMVFSKRIASGNLENNGEITINPHAQGELQVLLCLMEKMRVNLVNTQHAIQKQADDGLRIKLALDVSASCVMIADKDYRIFYMNHAMKQLMKNNAAAFSEVLPDFNLDTLMGSQIDIFHKNPAHQRRILDALQTTFTSEDLHINGRWVRIIATPVLNEHGERIAVSTEWEDRTMQRTVEKEVEQFVSAAVRGDFSTKMAVDGKSGFLLTLTESLNAMNEVVNAAFTDTAEALKALENGDLTHRISRDYQGVYDDIQQAANNTADKLADIMSNIRNTAMNVADGSAEISNGNSTLSDRTQEQAAALEETSASLEELTGTVQQNADNARQANQLAMTTSDQAEQGRKVVGQAIEAVAGISQSSKKIADIIGVIDEIAFQTNLLALNAAVEAARAGEQGRGFAVVAGEVRTLAQRSAEAAKEIKELINASVDSVDQGSKLVNESGKALGDIVGSVQKVTDIIAEIAAASQEQSQGVDQINKAITQLDSAVQQNAALVEETAASSANLDHEAGEVLASVSEFHLGDHMRQQRRQPAASRQAAAPSMKKALPDSSNAPAKSDDMWEEF